MRSQREHDTRRTCWEFRIAAASCRSGPTRPGVGERVVQDGFPVFGEASRPPVPESAYRPGLPADGSAASFSICFGVGMRQLAGRSVIPD